MATFSIQLDCRKKLQNGMYNLVVRINVGNDMMYLNISKLTKEQYDRVFVKRAGDDESITFREKCNSYRTKCERIYNKLRPFNKTRFRELFYEEEKDIPKTLLLKDLFKDYYTTNENIKHSSKGRYRSSMINKARECYASILNRANKSVVKIAETMGHSTVAVTINHYIGGMNNEELFDLNDALFRNCARFSARIKVIPGKTEEYQ